VLVFFVRILLALQFNLSRKVQCRSGNSRNEKLFTEGCLKYLTRSRDSLSESVQSYETNKIVHNLLV